MKQFFTKGLLFFIMVFLLFTLMIYGATRINYSADKTVLRQVTKNPVKKGGDTFMKFYQAENLTEPVDILVIGTSRAHRAFDPATFDKQNLNIHILASSSQTPLNTYYLCRKYIPLLKPRLVIFDLHTGLMNNNGLESLYDLCENTPISVELFSMAWAIDQTSAYANCYATLINQLDTPIYRNYTFEKRSWYDRGFIISYKTDSTLKKGDDDGEMMNRKLMPREEKNLQYVEKTIDFIREAGIPVVLTRQPVLSTEPLVVMGKITELAKRHQILFIDLNKELSILNPTHDFLDKNHLNTYGARIVSGRILEELRINGVKF